MGGRQFFAGIEAKLQYFLERKNSTYSEQLGEQLLRWSTIGFRVLFRENYEKVKKIDFEKTRALKVDFWIPASYSWNFVIFTYVVADVILYPIVTFSENGYVNVENEVSLIEAPPSGEYHRS